MVRAKNVENTEIFNKANPRDRTPGLIAALPRDRREEPDSEKVGQGNEAETERKADFGFTDPIDDSNDRDSDLCALYVEEGVLNGRGRERQGKNQIYPFKRDSVACISAVCGVVFSRGIAAAVAVDKGSGAFGSVLCDGIVFPGLAFGNDHADGTEYSLGSNGNPAGRICGL